jgi:hypothetical protein
MTAAVLSALLSVALGPVPKNDDPAPGEDKKMGPMDVCNDIADAAKKDDVNRLLAHVTKFGRERFGEKERVAVKAAHHLFVGVKCVRIDQQDESSALIWVYAPDHQSQQMPFLRVNGYWRLDEERWEQMKKAKSSH